MEIFNIIDPNFWNAITVINIFTMFFTGVFIGGYIGYKLGKLNGKHGLFKLGNFKNDEIRSHKHETIKR